MNLFCGIVVNNLSFFVSVRLFVQIFVVCGIMVNVLFFYISFLKLEIVIISNTYHFKCVEDKIIDNSIHNFSNYLFLISPYSFNLYNNDKLTGKKVHIIDLRRRMAIIATH